MVPLTSECADDSDMGGPPGNRLKDGELEITLILVRAKTLCFQAALTGFLDFFGAQGVEVADQEIAAEFEALEEAKTSVGCDALFKLSNMGPKSLRVLFRATSRDEDVIRTRCQEMRLTRSLISW